MNPDSAAVTDVAAVTGSFGGIRPRRPSARFQARVTWLASMLGVVLLCAGCAGTRQAAPHASPAPSAPHATSSMAPGPPHASTTPSTPGPAPAPPVPGPARPCGVAAAAPARYQHVVWIWMENHDTASVIGSSEAPFLTSLSSRCGTDVRYAAVGSPSLPNYLGATSGSTQGVTDDGDPTTHSFGVSNLFHQVRAAGGTERSFVEAMPAPCTLVSGGSYAAKHNPAAYYVGPGDRAACHLDDVPFAQFAAALGGGSLPTYTSITPDLCNDMHDCPVATGDAWLAAWVPRILASPAYVSGSTALFIVWDEPTPVADVVVAPAIRPGTVSTAPVDHYSLLRATEEMLGLPLLGRAASATSLRGVFGI